MTERPKKAELTKQVGIWIRVSTEDQALGDSPAIHETRAREYAKFNGWNVREVYDLAGVSGKTVMEHPEAKRMLDDIKRGHITALIFSKLARLARNTRELLEFSDFFQSHGADMVSLHEKMDTGTPAGRLFYTIIAAMAQWEREEIADRIRASVATRSKLGQQISGTSPYGYVWKDGKMVIEPKEAIIRKQIYELFLEHRRIGTVARMLNEAGYRTRAGATWSDTAVLRCIVHPTAKGVRYSNVFKKTGSWAAEEKPEDQWFVHPIEPIVSEEVWSTANRMIEERKKQNKRPTKRPTHIFAGIAHCHCGHRMYVPTTSTKYVCHKCKNKIPAADLESIFHEELKNYFADPERITRHFLAAKKNTDEKEQRVALHRQEIEKTKEEMTRTHRLYLDGRLNDQSFTALYRPLEDQVRQLGVSIPALEAELAFLRINEVSADQVLRDAQKLYERWPQLTTERKRRVIESIVEKITIGTDDISVTYCYIPSSEELTLSQQRLPAP
ncbi:recombinase family protein [Opitutus sp. GAS368]|uniref:recombinase family protein n=1 Tax=Opitutus sp. GAS368 TaxID=1882749 RepID=UPI00087C7E6C|nr:recombinase family protein [Opitutus sp. GAS368]SDS02572.1 site-specific DNA recombinase [Opitutus sp. GAS368]